MVSLILLVGLIVATIAAIPAWPHSMEWSYVPTIVAGVVLLAVIVAMLVGWI